MSRYDDDDLELDETSDVKDTPLVKDLRKQIKDLQKQNQTLNEENSGFKTKQRVSDLAEVIKSKGLDAKVASLYPKDAEATPEAVDAWLAEYGTVFGIKAGSDEQTPDAPEADATDPGLDPTMQRAYLRMQATEGSAQVPAARLAEMQKRIAEAKTPEELTAAISGR